MSGAEGSSGAPGGLEELRAFLGPVHAGTHVVSSGRRVAFTEGRLVDARDALCATATSTLFLVER